MYKNMNPKLIMYAIELENVTYYYPDGSLGVKDVTIRIKRGEKVALIGSNGCGKSTTLLLMAGLIEPEFGVVKIFEKDIKTWDKSSLRKTIGILFQNPDDFLFNPTVKEELLYTPAQLDIPFEEALNMVKNYAKMFNLERILNKPPFRLSSGEKKKVALACVIMLNPQILLLDEPTTNIDGRTRKKILSIIEEFEGTLVLATHELDIATQIVDRVIILGMNKTILADGDVSLLEDKVLLEKASII